MQDWLSAQAMARPQGLAMVCDGESLTYHDLDTRAGQAAAGLRARGVGRGDRVALLPSNSIEAVVAIHAIARTGATLVLLNTRLTAAELNAQLVRVNARALLFTSETQEIAKRLDVCVEHAMLVNDVEARYAAQLQLGDINLGAEGCILFTSGTSGTPKAAVLTWGNFWHSALASAYRIGVLPHDRWLCVLPLFHVGGLSIVLRSCLYGTAIDLRRTFDAVELDAALRTEPITLVSLVPTMLHRLLDVKQPDTTYAALRLVLLGGAAASSELMARAQAADIAIATTYGLTEATSQVCTALPVDALRKPASVGKPLPFTQVRVIDPAGNDAPPNTEGEVIARGPTVMRGYLDDDVSTARAIQDGWLHTGDIGKFDDEGDLFILQRRSDLIVSGGENVYPADVEAALRQHPSVVDCLVIGVDSAEWGQQVAALVVASTPLNERDLVDFARARIAGYKVPRMVRFVDALPLNASGKPDRKQAAAVFASESAFPPALE
jgi:O-succinylbenzoic acid--CoA ligase